MPFGKHKGRRISKLPDEYLDWLYNLDDLRQPLRDAVHSEWQRRFGAPDEKALQLIPAALRDITHEIINRGYRATAKHHHPDVGGTHEAMLRLQEAAEILRRIAG